MDNLTHSLIGALWGEAAARLIPAVKSTLPPNTRRNLFVTLMVVGSNLPDLDILYTSFTDGKLGYLLHHRGHTHTVIGAVVAAILLLAVALAWLHWRKVPASREDTLWLALCALFAPLLHIAMDAANSYGVHPFWPFDNDWFYGDSIFIVEPLFWATAAPLVFVLQSRMARTVVALILVIGILLSFGTGLVPRPLAFALTLLTATLLCIGWCMSERVAVLSGLSVAVAVFGMFLFTGQLARTEVVRLANSGYADAVLLDAVLTPMPVNPLCWETILVQLHEDEYTLRRAIFALAPQWLPSAQCPSRTPTSAAADFRQVALAGSAALQWYGEITMSRAELQTVIRDNCEAAALTRFARALWLGRRGEQRLMGDLRFYSEAGSGLADLLLSPQPARCPQHVPPWTPPRSDVLEPP